METILKMRDICKAHNACYDKALKGDETEFHCGVEESGGHAYNCNDCPNKCDEWHQWDKEMKND